MTKQNFPDNVLYEMDNLDVLRGMNSETVDLIATDPPFNTKRNRAGTAGYYVDNWKWGDTGILPDQWKWNEVHPAWLEQIKDDNRALFEVIEATGHCHGDDIAAFLCFLSVRLLEMHRVLKPTGSIYLHCDHSANAYIRMAMDAIFGAKNFRNEIVWAYTGPANVLRQFPRKHDTIFFYAKSNESRFNRDAVRIPYHKETIARRGRVEGERSYIAPSVETQDRRSNKQVESRFGSGKVPEDWWSDIAVLTNQRERTGSPDQKPLALYERIIKASSNEGDLVLDPFAGCATTMIAARNLGRRFAGIDRRKDAPLHVINRIMGTDYDIAELGQKPDFADFIHKQFNILGYRYIETPPERTDEGDVAPHLAPVYPTRRPATMRRSDMLKVLTDKWGVLCWGCGFEPPSVEYLDLDHITPASEGGSNELDNRAPLCGPCNRHKSNTKTLTGLRRDNRKAGRWYGTPAIDKRILVRLTSDWARDYLKNMPTQVELSVVAD